jgi:hypothetical protein
VFRVASASLCESVSCDVVWRCVFEPISVVLCVCFLERVCVCVLFRVCSFGLNLRGGLAGESCSTMSLRSWLMKRAFASSSCFSCAQRGGRRVRDRQRGSLLRCDRSMGGEYVLVRENLWRAAESTLCGRQQPQEECLTGRARGHARETNQRTAMDGSRRSASLRSGCGRVRETAARVWVCSIHMVATILLSRWSRRYSVRPLKGRGTTHADEHGEQQRPRPRRITLTRQRRHNAQGRAEPPTDGSLR